MYTNNKQLYLLWNPGEGKKQIWMSPLFLDEKKGNRKGGCQHFNLL